MAIDPTATNLEAIVYTITDSINKRHLDPDYVVYVGFADPAFTCLLTPPAPPIRLNKQQYFDRVGQLLAVFPELRMEIKSLDTYIDLRTGEGQVFSNYEIHGWPPGVIRQSIGIYRFRRSPVDGIWRCFLYESVQGMDAGPSEA